MDNTNIPVPQATDTATAPTPELTYGQKAVGFTFNPSGDPMVTQLKTLYAQIIDLLAQSNPNNGDVSLKDRFLGRAINEAVSAQMWAVKSVTFKE